MNAPPGFVVDPAGSPEFVAAGTIDTGGKAAVGAGGADCSWTPHQAAHVVDGSKD